MLPLDTPIDVTYIQNGADGVECRFEDHKIVIPYEQLTWEWNPPRSTDYQDGDTIPVRLTEYLYQEGYYLASYRMTLERNPYRELFKFPRESIFRGVVLEDYAARTRSSIIPSSWLPIELPNGAWGLLNPSFRRHQLKKGLHVHVICTNMIFV